MNFKRIVLIFAFLFISVGLLGYISVAKAQTMEELSTQIAALKKQITDYQKEIAELQAKITALQNEMAKLLAKQIALLQSQIAQLQTQLLAKPPTKPESEYKCPDLNGDGVVNIYDITIISARLNTCQGATNYDPRGDVDGDNCLTNTDLNYVNKYYGKSISEITQCGGGTTLEYIERMVASIADAISQLTKGVKELLK